MRVTIFLVLLLGSIPLDLRAETTTATFDLGSPPDDATCGEAWIEAGLSMHVEPTTSDDCATGPCDFGRAHGFPGNISLSPARLVIDVAPLGDVIQVEADVQDGTGLHRTQLLLYEGSTLIASVSNQQLGAIETLQLSAGQATVTHVVVSSCGGHCFEVRIESRSSVAVSPSSWATVKALFD